MAASHLHVRSSAGGPDRSHRPSHPCCRRFAWRAHNPARAGGLRVRRPPWQAAVRWRAGQHRRSPSRRCAQVRTGDGAVVIGQVRLSDPTRGVSIKLPTTVALCDHLTGVPEVLEQPSGRDHQTKREIRDIAYQRVGRVGILSFDFYNGAMSSSNCRRLAARADCGAGHAGAGHPWRGDLVQRRPPERHRGGRRILQRERGANIDAIDDVCRQIMTCRQPDRGGGSRR